MSLPAISRRTVLKSGLAATALGSLQQSSTGKKNDGPQKQDQAVGVPLVLRQNSLETLCTEAAKMGLVGVDLLNPEEYECRTATGSPAPWAT